MRDVARNEKRSEVCVAARDLTKIGDVYESYESVRLVDDREIELARVTDVCQQLFDGGSFEDHLGRRFVGIRNMKPGEHVAVGALLDRLAAAAEPAAVQRIGTQPARHVVTYDYSEHQRNHYRVVVRHLEYEQDSRDGCVGCAGDHRAHAYQRVRFGVQSHPRKKVRKRDSERPPGRGSDVQGRGEHAAGATHVQCNRSRENLAEGQREQSIPRDLTEDIAVHGEVAIADQPAAGEEHEQADRRASDPRRQRGWKRALLLQIPEREIRANV